VRRAHSGRPRATPPPTPASPPRRGSRWQPAGWRR
jgi:hypothetical protein